MMFVKERITKMTPEQLEIKRLHAFIRQQTRQMDELAAVVVGLFLGAEKQLTTILGEDAIRVARAAIAETTNVPPG
jgi:hypothetical protein